MDILSRNSMIRLSKINHSLTRFWRCYGVKLSFFFTIYLVWSCISQNVVGPPRDRDLSPWQSAWLISWRLCAMLFAPFTLTGVVSMLLYTAPDENREVHDMNNANKRKSIRLILRIVTRGDYPKLIRDVVDYHENLFKTFWRRDDDEIDIHVATETPLNVARQKRNGNVHRCEVKEFRTPVAYATPNKTIYKLRNCTYALERCLEEAKRNEESLERIWVISIDEDVFLTKCWLDEFDDTVLNSNLPGHYKFVHSTSRPIFLDVHDGVGGGSWSPPIVPFFAEAFRLALDLSRCWWQAKLFGRGAVGMRGSCYALRLDVESRLGYDFGGQYLSVADDSTFFHRLMLEKDVKLKFMDAWFLEGSPHSALALIKQRERWVRNNLYCVLFSDIPRRGKIQLGAFLLGWTILMPLGSFLWLTGGALLLVNDSAGFFPAGAPCPLVDFISCVSSGCVMYWYIYGCAMMLPWYWAVLVSLTFSTYVPVAPLHFIGAVAAVYGLLRSIYELTVGGAEWRITKKISTD